jgi:hypothetical protein
VTGTNLPLWNAVALKGWTAVLIRLAFMVWLLGVLIGLLRWSEY